MKNCISNCILIVNLILLLKCFCNIFYRFLSKSNVYSIFIFVEESFLLNLILLRFLVFFGYGFINYGLSGYVLFLTRYGRSSWRLLIWIVGVERIFFRFVFRKITLRRKTRALCMFSGKLYVKFKNSFLLLIIVWIIKLYCWYRLK